MASIFTFDPDPPRVSSPWATPHSSTPHGENTGTGSNSPKSLAPRKGQTPSPKLLSDCGIVKLEAEPQDGPTEYKLHLLLRPRKSLTASSTVQRVSGSHHSRLATKKLSFEDGSTLTPPAAAPSTHSRQHRLQQLTTQLLWRLQQSSPYHSSAAGNVILPNLPDVGPVLGTPNRPSRLLPGLEESRGALYEIGVSDDGTLVGLTKDEMDESLNNLRAMASSLGCDVQLLRMIVVGTCQWTEESTAGDQITQFDDLWVAEALVKPNYTLKPTDDLAQSPSLAPQTQSYNPKELSNTGSESLHSPIEQLRVSLTGATTSGKSSLLGTLSTATLDNGRGKSRLSLLKHRHELVSGVTSSVAQELIGYTKPGQVDSDSSQQAEVINFASGNVSSWTDIHASADSGRLVFFSDSAGHPRYRRTTVRGLVGWAPHWTLLCVAADDNDESELRVGSTLSARDVLGSAAADVDLSQAHLELCLKLQIPIVVVITKLDLASKTGLRLTLGKVLSALKAWNRKPLLFSAGASGIDVSRESDLHSISTDDWNDVQKAFDQLDTDDPCHVVPIVLTSAVKGIGISKMHAILCNLPIPRSTIPQSSEVYENSISMAGPRSSLFHIEEVFALSNAASLTNSEEVEKGSGFVVGGHLRYGEMAVGDEFLVGPFAVDASSSDVEDSIVDSLKSASIPAEKRLDGSPALDAVTSLSKLSLASFDGSDATSEKNTEWRAVRIASVRNLRLPVRKLLAGQVGTLGIVPTKSSPAKQRSRSAEAVAYGTLPSLRKLRKGMVLTACDPSFSLTSSSTFSAIFTELALTSLTVGTVVAVYIASIRATARIISLRKTLQDKDGDLSSTHKGSPDTEVFGFDDGLDAEEEALEQQKAVRIEFQFVSQKEWIEHGTKVLIMPGAAGQGLYGSHGDRAERGGLGAASAAAGLEGFVGSIV